MIYSDKRVLNWNVYLIDYVESLLGKPFVWGSTHCTALVFGCLDKMYGTKLLKEHYEEYPNLSLTKAREFCKTKNTKTKFEEIGLKEVDGYPMCGDILYVNDEDDGLECCHIVLNQYVLGSSREFGVRLITLKQFLELTEDYKVYR